MKPSTKRALSLILSAGFLIAALVIYGTFIRPEYRLILGWRGELASKSNLLEKQQAVMTNMQNLIAQYRSTERLGDSLSLALPVKENVSSVMSQLNAVSQFSGLALQSVGISYLPIKSAPGKSSLNQGLGAFRLDLRLFGNYSGLKKFLSALETNIQIMDVKALKLEPASKTESDIFTYLLTVDTYYQTK
ncbi:MAG: type 4a pilus biogenesis protein PilO [Candidatus Harrisonbacteria bacterium]|nr:type 4a pilus biogenesis protein PilO [Candidatus Harrisonbacteria bacterium]